MEREIDFVDAAEVFAGRTVTRPDERRDYGEPRWITTGYLKTQFVVLVSTERGPVRRIVSMRFGHGNEEADWF